MKHTPGPWIIFETPLGIEITADDADLGHPATVICEVMDDKHEAANARLIAAAPDMVEALLDAIAVIEAHINMTGTYKRGIYGHLPSSCRDALRKIRGE